MDSIYSVFLVDNKTKTWTESAMLFMNAKVLNSLNSELVFMCVVSCH